MRSEVPALLHQHRVREGLMASDDSCGLVGAFVLFCPDTGRTLRVVASDGRDWSDNGLPGEPWEHVSVSLAGRDQRTPAWPEMAWVKGLFWGPDELVLQFHPPESVYVHESPTGHKGVLHLWRPKASGIPLPPLVCV